MIKNNLKLLALIIGFASLITLNSCNDDDPPLPDNLVSFQTGTLGLEGNETTIRVVLSRPEEVAVTLSVSLAPNKVTYGTQFTTSPAATANKITLVIPAGNAEGTITVTKAAGIFLNGDESVDFTISEVTAPVLAGEQASLKLSFSAITSEGATLTLQGKTDVSNFTNAVFVDMSGNSQTSVERKKWALGFYSGSEFRVVLNHSFQMIAAPVDKTDLNAVTVTDAQASSIYGFDQNAATAGSINFIDSWDGNLTKTVIAEVSATASSNKVYFVVPDYAVAGVTSDVANWYKIRVVRNGEGYTLQYAKVSATTFQSLNIAKDTNFNHVFVSLGNNADGTLPAIEPKKVNWDFAWSYTTYNSGMNTPYGTQDFISINYLAGVQAAEITSADATAAATAYTNFNESNIAALTFLSTRDVIGTKWRSAFNGIFRTKFYVVKDTYGNVYKLKFVSAGINSDGGERGKPVIEYKLVKRAN